MKLTMKKRILDISISLFAIILLLPLIIVTSIIVIFFLGRPVLFVQPRPGLYGKVFNLYKFRTMRNSLNSDGTLCPDGLRLTPTGAILRKFSLDELPQLYNVFIGDMSLVGPRPLLTKYMNLYTPQQALRHNVKPGITGWAQIYGRNRISWEEKLELDLWYVQHQSVWLDLKILIKTIFKVVRRDGINAEGEATSSEFLGTPPKKE